MRKNEATHLSAGQLSDMIEHALEQTQKSKPFFSWPRVHYKPVAGLVAVCCMLVVIMGVWSVPNVPETAYSNDDIHALIVDDMILSYYAE